MATDAIEKQTKVWNSEFCSKIIDLTSKVYSDQTGWFPVTLSKSNYYIIVVYDHDSNAILAEALKLRVSNEHLQAIQKVHNFLNQYGIKLKLYIIDNECSNVVKNYIKHTKNIEYLLVLPHMYWVNLVEKVIDIFKSHFIIGFDTINPDFPLYL